MSTRVTDDIVQPTTRHAGANDDDGDSGVRRSVILVSSGETNDDQGNVKSRRQDDDGDGELEHGDVGVGDVGGGSDGGGSDDEEEGGRVTVMVVVPHTNDDGEVEVPVGASAGSARLPATKRAPTSTTASWGCLRKVETSEAVVGVGVVVGGVDAIVFVVVEPSKL